MRDLDPAWVELIAASMRERGQDTPMVVGPADGNGVHSLIAGAHRVAAAKLAGLAEINAIVSEATGAAADLLEIDENLLRRELSQLDRAVFLARRQQVWQQLHPETARGKAPKQRSAARTTSLSPLVETFTAATARSLGLDQRSIQRAIARARIPADIRGIIARHPVANSGSQLDQLAALPHAEQLRVVTALTRADRPASSVAAAIAEGRQLPPSSREKQVEQIYRQMVAVWEKAAKMGEAGLEAQRLFERHIGSATRKSLDDAGAAKKPAGTRGA